MATHTSQREKSATVSQSCGSTCVGSPSFVKNRKKKFGYNNGKCLHGLNGVMLEFGTQWNSGRLFLRCPLRERADLRCEYFVWADEMGMLRKARMSRKGLKKFITRQSSTWVDTTTTKM
ncbi:hypothetical protein PIB30_013383 [Stylosanthes scabra]|uniref:GRF-type domain-containing protein n=1 Tax=Stylosanthes scabra TaxID=79078 RepID=A0ABU6W853_9FABA|nr:hypothetical protein [Stylosanthes scabra]